MKKISVLLGLFILMTCVDFLVLQDKSDKYIDTKKESIVSVSITEQKEIPT